MIKTFQLFLMYGMNFHLTRHQKNQLMDGMIQIPPT